MKKVLFILIIFYCLTGCFNNVENTKDESEDFQKKEELVRMNIESLIWNYTTNYRISLYSSYNVGKITSVTCLSDENEYDGNGRFLMRCKYSYNPQGRNGNIKLDEEVTNSIYVMLMKISDDKFMHRSFKGGTTYKEQFKSDYCWGKSKDLLFDCKNDSRDEEDSDIIIDESKIKNYIGWDYRGAKEDLEKLNYVVMVIKSDEVSSSEENIVVSQYVEDGAVVLVIS